MTRKKLSPVDKRRVNVLNRGIDIATRIERLAKNKSLPASMRREAARDTKDFRNDIALTQKRYGL